jgi:hypothetical protein
VIGIRRFLGGTCFRGGAKVFDLTSIITLNW